mmetsp:Transcript_56260/g.138014  ORF Transcript_56260/g.138014 Transcript_56260/m.138014 type:complete len:208 (+) Transcript_56260:513-1136(+)
MCKGCFEAVAAGQECEIIDRDMATGTSSTRMVPVLPGSRESISDFVGLFKHLKEVRVVHCIKCRSAASCMREHHGLVAVVFPCFLDAVPSPAFIIRSPLRALPGNRVEGCVRSVLYAGTHACSRGEGVIQAAPRGVGGQGHVGALDRRAHDRQVRVVPEDRASGAVRRQKLPQDLLKVPLSRCQVLRARMLTSALARAQERVQAPGH